jgi:hypothetical protein
LIILIGLLEIRFSSSDGASDGLSIGQRLLATAVSPYPVPASELEKRP